MLEGDCAAPWLLLVCKADLMGVFEREVRSLPRMRLEVRESARPVRVERYRLDFIHGISEPN